MEGNDKMRESDEKLGPRKESWRRVMREREKSPRRTIRGEETSLQGEETVK